MIINYDDSATSVAEQSAISFVFPAKFYKACVNPDHGNIFTVINAHASESSMQVWQENARIARQRKSMGCTKYYFQVPTKFKDAWSFHDRKVNVLFLEKMLISSGWIA